MFLKKEISTEGPSTIANARNRAVEKKKDLTPRAYGVYTVQERKHDKQIFGTLIQYKEPRSTSTEIR